MSSASTQWAAVGWYSYWVPGSHIGRHLAKRAHRPSLVSPSSGGSGACGKPPVWVMTCSTVMASLPLVANSAM